jgi:hypothetical protein
VLRAERVTDGSINGVLDRSVIVAALWLQEPLFHQTIDLSIGQREDSAGHCMSCTKKSHPLGGGNRLSSFGAHSAARFVS